MSILNYYSSFFQVFEFILTFPFPVFQGESKSEYNLLLNTWFPDDGHYEVRLADTGEEAVLLQDWLRMKMVTSGVPKLVDTGE